MSDQTEKRALNLFKEDGTPRIHLSAALYAFCVFPDDERSRVQALHVFDTEFDAYRDDPDSYSFSNLVQVMITWIENRSGQRIVAGLTALAIVALKLRDEEDISLYRAAKLVETALKIAKQTEERPLKIWTYDNGQPSLKGVRVPSGRRDIEKAFKAHSSVAHILAADLLCANCFDNILLFEHTIEMGFLQINTAAFMEAILLEASPAHFVDPWLINPMIPDYVQEYGMAPFEEGFVDFLFDLRPSES